ncbi:uncharacterized protein DUF3971 [Albidovulum inexpectatum]|uniref:Uncharacterized protein DUF3971 n=1 Tax=Albidovulum inexpectatum TaxID=196587 RepID=A0A2S5JK07_9RHOB|nr:AsmA-like C-terminal region-containing protein [Albidovulum inexpectatum]PPB81731.1 uncharacterized protein DUF3971 [Albidovulum inexpectatum]
MSKAARARSGGRKPIHRQAGWFSLWLMLALVVTVGTLIALGVSGFRLPAPGWVVERLETRLNAALGDTAHVRIGAISLGVDERLVPRVRFNDIELTSPAGARIALLPESRLGLHMRPLLSGRVEPRFLRVRGARFALRRLADGRLDLSLGTAIPIVSFSPAEFLKLAGDVFDRSVLSGIEDITIDDLNLRLDDMRTGRVWATSRGRLRLTQDDEALRIEIGSNFGTDVPGAADRVSRAELQFERHKGSPRTTLSIEIFGVRSRDLSVQSPALAFLAALDAPISGRLTTGLDERGRYLGLSGRLDLAAGALRPTPEAAPVPFDRVILRMAYDPERAQLRFDEIALDGPALRARAKATTWLRDFDGAWPGALVSQVEIGGLQVDPEGVFQQPVEFHQGQFDFRLRLDPFSLEIGQLTLIEDRDRITARGRVGADEKGWTVSVDSQINQITTDRLLALWPIAVKPKTRKWLADNVAAGQMFNLQGAYRAMPGHDPRLYLGWEFYDAEVRFLRAMPLIRQGSGHGVIADDAYTLVVNSGHVMAQQGGRIDLSDSVMHVPNLREKPALAQFTIRTDSSVTAALWILDQKPFEFLKKSDRPVELAEGRARLTTQLEFRMVPKVRPQDVSITVDGELTDVRSDRIVPGRELTAKSLRVRADRAGLEISGAARFAEIPVTASWRQRFGPEYRGKSELTGEIEISPPALKALKIALPDGFLSGKGTGQIDLALTRGQPARFELISDLKGIGLSIPQIGWSKAAGSTGAFRMAGLLTTPARIDSLSLSAPGFEASGALSLASAGGLERLRLDKLRIGSWFAGAVDLVGRGAGRPPAVIIRGGVLDLRNLPRLGGATGPATPMTVSLDRVRVGEKLSLTDFRGDLSSQGGLSGAFSASVNGGAEISGQLAPEAGRTAIRIRAGDAGRVLRDAGLFQRGLGGTLDLGLTPRTGGAWRGDLRLKDMRVVDAPVLASLLSAISVVGLLDQLAGPGLPFDSIAAIFDLTPDQVVIRRASAVGPSLGISAEGVYDLRARAVDVQGTISPVYLVNQIGEGMTRRGEGMFGFNYRVTGTVERPRVSVNPLSILMPGPLRELFRGLKPVESE